MALITPTMQVPPSTTGEEVVELIQTCFKQNANAREHGAILLDAPHLVMEDGQLHLAQYDDGDDNDDGSNDGDDNESAPLVLDTRQVVEGVRVHKGELPGTYLLLHKSQKPTKRAPAPPPPPHPENCSLHKVANAAELETALSSSFAPGTRATCQYTIYDLTLASLRPASDFKLHCGQRMLDFVDARGNHLPGLHAAFGFYSNNQSLFGGHVEDYWLASLNVVFCGAPKMWIVVQPGDKNRLEERIKSRFKGRSKSCGQFMRHLGLFLLPSQLKEWNIRFHVILQKPGQVVAVLGRTAHWGVNLGTNYAEAINFAISDDYTLPTIADYKPCSPGSCSIPKDQCITLQDTKQPSAAKALPMAKDNEEGGPLADGGAGGAGRSDSGSSVLDSIMVLDPPVPSVGKRMAPERAAQSTPQRKKQKTSDSKTLVSGPSTTSPSPTKTMTTRSSINKLPRPSHSSPGPPVAPEQTRTRTSPMTDVSFAHVASTKVKQLRTLLENASGLERSLHEALEQHDQSLQQLEAECEEKRTSEARLREELARIAPSITSSGHADMDNMRKAIQEASFEAASKFVQVATGELGAVQEAVAELKAEHARKFAILKKSFKDEWGKITEVCNA